MAPPSIITSPSDGRHRLWDPSAEDFVGVWEPEERHLAEAALRKAASRHQSAARRRAPTEPTRVVGPFEMRARSDALRPVDPSRPFAQQFSHGWLAWNPITRSWVSRKGLGAMTRREAERELNAIAERMNGGARGR